MTKRFVPLFFLLMAIRATTANSDIRLKPIGVDDQTGTRFSMIVETDWLAGMDPCTGGYHELEVIGEVPSNVPLADDTVAKAIVAKAKAAVATTCKRFNLSNGELHIRLFAGQYGGQMEKFQVYAAWEKVYLRFSEQALKGEPQKYQNRALELFQAEQLVQERIKAGVDASKITVTATYKLDTNSAFPRFSPDNKLILYSKDLPEKGRQVQIIKDLKTRTIVKTFGEAGTSRQGAWSSDLKRIAYFGAPERGVGFFGVSGYLHIFDMTSGKDVKLDYKEPTPGTFIVWAKEQEIYILETSSGRRGGISLNLETLIQSRLAGDIYDQLLKGTHYEQYAQHDWWSDFNKHKYCYIYRQDISRGQPSLIVANTDNSYARALVKGVFAQHPYVIASDLSAVVYAQESDLYIAYLGQRAEPPKTLKTELSDTAFAEKVEAGLKDGQRIIGTVFGPRINPLNNKLVGPEEKTFKGHVRFTASDGGQFIVTTTFEWVPFGPGDIVSEIYAKDGSLGRDPIIDRPIIKVWGVLRGVGK
jgi:hypothetical protein